MIRQIRTTHSLKIKFVTPQKRCVVILGPYLRSAIPRAEPEEQKHVTKPQNSAFAVFTASHQLGTPSPREAAKLCPHCAVRAPQRWRRPQQSPRQPNQEKVTKGRAGAPRKIHGIVGKAAGMWHKGNCYSLGPPDESRIDTPLCCLTRLLGGRRR